MKQLILKKLTNTCLYILHSVLHYIQSLSYRGKREVLNNSCSFFVRFWLENLHEDLTYCSTLKHIDHIGIFRDM